MEPLALKIVLEEADVRRGLLFTITRHSPGLRLMPLFFGLAVLALVGEIVWMTRGHRPGAEELLFLGACLAFLTLIPYGLWRLGARMFRGVRPEATWRLRESGVQIESGEAVTTLPWESLYRTYETAHAFYVHSKPSVFHVLPKRELDDATREAVRD